MFVVIQSWLNIIEGILLIICVFMSFLSKISTQLWAGLIEVITSTSVFWKTVIFFLGTIIPGVLKLLKIHLGINSVLLAPKIIMAHIPLASNYLNIGKNR